MDGRERENLPLIADRRVSTKNAKCEPRYACRHSSRGIQLVTKAQFLSDLHILGEGLEPYSIGLDDGDGDGPGLTGVDVSYRSGFSLVGADNNPTGGAILQFDTGFVFHVEDIADFGQ
jgi:hypothetical protein